MKNLNPLRAAFAAFALATLAGAAQAGHFVEISPSKAYIHNEGMFDDWVLVFNYPFGARFDSVVPTTNRARKLWNYAANKGGLNTLCYTEVFTTAGYSARLFSRSGVPSIDAWKREMKIRVWVP